MAKDTSKATAGKIASSIKNLKSKIEERDKLLKEYEEKVETYLKEKSIKANTAELRKYNQDITKLEKEIQTNINANYSNKKETYDDYFKTIGGRPKNYLRGKGFQFAKTQNELEKLKQPSDFIFPDASKSEEEPKPSGESGAGFGSKQGEAKTLTETKATEREPKPTEPKGKGKARETEAPTTQTTEADNDIKRAREMPEAQLSRMKDIINYMEDFKPTEHELLIERRNRLIANNPQYMDLTKDERERLKLFYTQSAFNTFDIDLRNDVINQAEAASKIAEMPKQEAEKQKEKEPSSISKAVGEAVGAVAKAIGDEPDLDTDPATEGSGSKDEPQREGDEHKIKSGDSNAKANAEPGDGTSGAEKKEEATAAPTAATATTTTTTTATQTMPTAVESTDPDTATKFEGMEGELVLPFAGGAPSAFKGDILSQLEPQSEVASKLAEDKMRRRKDVERLIQEIECFHLIYNDYIPLFKTKEHEKDKEDAIASKDRDKLIKHHLITSNAIRQYYKTADLRVGVIMSAESMFGQSVSNLISGHMASGGAALPNALGGAKFFPKGSDPVKGAVAGDVTIRRGGRNTKRPIARLVPKSGFSADATPIPEITPVVDAPFPYVFQTGVRRRPQYRNQELKLKVKK
jgi:hypothetical protein